MKSSADEGNADDSAAVAAPLLPADSPSDDGVSAGDGMDDYRRLQQRLILATLVAVSLAVPVTAWFFGFWNALSLCLGGLAGLLYLRLLSRSVARLGADRRSVGKVQLLVPVVLVMAAARIPQLEILPALVGFLLYKPALLVQAVLDA